jgi:hypothetical protein
MDSASASATVFQEGLYLTVPTVAVACVAFLAASRLQPADSKAMKAETAGGETDTGGRRLVGPASPSLQ